MSKVFMMRLLCVLKARNRKKLAHIDAWPGTARCVGRHVTAHVIAATDQKNAYYRKIRVFRNGTLEWISGTFFLMCLEYLIFYRLKYLAKFLNLAGT